MSHQHPNSSTYTLETVQNVDARTPLIATDDANYGAAEVSETGHRQRGTKRILFQATLKMAAIFVVSTAILGGTLWLALPTLDELAECPLGRLGIRLMYTVTEMIDPC
jgi:hypothetical protein